MVTSGPKDKNKKRDMFGGFSKPIPAHVKKFLMKNFFSTEKAYQKALDKQFGGKTKSDKDKALSGGVAGGIGGRTKSDKDIKRVKGKPHLKHGGKAKKRKY